MSKFFNYSYFHKNALICREEINPFVYFISICFLIVVNSNHNDDYTNKSSQVVEREQKPIQGLIV